MTTISSRTKNTALFGLGAALLALGAGCANVSNYADALKSAPPSDAPLISDAPTSASLDTQSFSEHVKLPPKKTNAFGIGAVLPTDALHRELGKSLREGLDLAVAEVNAAGGVNGRPIQLDVVDSSPGAAGALRDRGDAIILMGDPTLAVAQAEQLASFPQLIGFLCDYVPATKLTPKNGVRIYLNGDQEGRAMESRLETAGVDHVTVLYTADQLAQSNQQYMLFLINGNHAIDSAAEAYSPLDRDFALLAKAVYHSKNEGLVLAGEGREYSVILAAFDAANWSGTVVGYAANGVLPPLSGAGGLQQTAAYPLPEFAVNPRGTAQGKAFADKYRAKYGVDPALPAAYAYDNIQLLAAATRLAASNDAQKIRANFIALHHYVGAAGPYDIKDDGDTEMPLRLWLANGQPAPDVHGTAPAAFPSGPPKL